MDNTLFEHKHVITDIDPENLTAVCSICGPVTVYVSCRRYTAYPKKVITPPLDIFETNKKIIKDYIHKHKCMRCGVCGLGMPEKFKFFELQLPLKQRVGRLVHKMDPDTFKLELQKRDLYCQTCYTYIARSYNKNIPVPPVKPLSI